MYIQFPSRDPLGRKARNLTPKIGFSHGVHQTNLKIFGAQILWCHRTSYSGYLHFILHRKGHRIFWLRLSPGKNLLWFGPRTLGRKEASAIEQARRSL